MRRSEDSSGAARIGVTLVALVAISVAGLSRGIATRAAQLAPSLADTTFAATVERLSEAPGYFDSDNLISNETSYLHAVSKLHQMHVSGGAYIGVGPDQNFSYIAAVRPDVAFIIDIRRDNMLMHLLFKALFERSDNRVEYLCRWLGREIPAGAARWDDSTVERILAAVDSLQPSEASASAETAALLATIRGYGVPLTPQDEATLRRFHNEFILYGLDIRFTSTNRPPRASYPTLRQLILERDLDSGQSSYLASRDAWRFVKQLEARNRIIPVVGNLAGPRALAAIGRDIAARDERVSALYVSNVEMYLWRDGIFPEFARSASGLPRDAHSVIVRSYFGGGFGQRHPLSTPRNTSTQLVQSLDDFADRWRHGGWGTYWELVNAGNR